VSWFVAEERDDGFEKLDGAAGCVAAVFVAEPGPANVEGMVEGRGVTACGVEEMERNLFDQVWSSSCSQVSAVVKNRFCAFHDAPCVVRPVEGACGP